MSEFQESRARSLLARFLVDRDASAEDTWRSWLERQEECLSDEALLDLASSIFEEWIRIGSALRAGQAEFGSNDETNRAGASPLASAFGGQLEPGVVIGDYELVREVGRGGMGVVWEAIQRSLGRVVALKVVLPERLDHKSLELFAREARAGGRLSHPNLVATFAHGVDRGLAWIAEELVVGSITLKDRIDTLRVADNVPKSHYRWAAQNVAAIADGLQAAHEAGVIHRDVKPANVLLAAGDVPKVTDFGLARVEDDPALSQTGDFAGTFYYMSPEQVTAKRMGLDHRTDIFSLGVMLFELLTFRRPFEGDTTHQIAEKIVVVDPPLASRFRSQCPLELAVICGKALEKAPAKRYQTMAEFAADLRRHLADEPIVAQPPGRIARLGKWCKRNPAVSAAGSVSVVALVIVSFLLVRTLRTSGANARLVVIANERAEQLADQTRLATERAEQLAEQTRLATRRLDVLLSQAAQLSLNTLVDEAASLWPAVPSMVPTYERWLRDARELREGRAADPERGVDERPGLERHLANLREIHSRSVLAEGDLASDTAQRHPDFGRLEAVRLDRTWYAQMLGVEPWPDLDAVRAKVLGEGVPSSEDVLWSLVQLIVDPLDRNGVPRSPLRGQELHALVVAEELLGWTLESDGPSELMALALLRAGRLDEASAVRDALVEEGADTADLDGVLADWDPSAVSERRRDLERLDDRVAGLEVFVGVRRLERPEDRAWHRELFDLIEQIEILHESDRGLASSGTSPDFGWGVGRRYDFARVLAERSVSSEEAKALWTRAAAAIGESELYDGLELGPQLGLLPLGPDPDSGLWEFAHLQSGTPAVRGDDGRLEVGEGTGLVFVLLPGGWVHGATGTSGPVEPFFVSKFEMTQGQWLQAAAVNPSKLDEAGYSRLWNRAGRGWSLLHPVENVTWDEAAKMMARLALILPDELQWEYACRGGTKTAFWTGDDVLSLQDAANLGDAFMKRNGGATTLAWEPDIDDGHASTAPVGSFRANPFGLHDVHGNVFEWCRAPTGGSSRDDEFARAARGGSYHSPGGYLRADYRMPTPPGLSVEFIGLRPARAIDRDGSIAAGR